MAKDVRTAEHAQATLVAFVFKWEVGSHDHRILVCGSSGALHARGARMKHFLHWQGVVTAPLLGMGKTHGIVS